jgi:hypothetical protein
MNCWEIASFLAFKYHRLDDPADLSWNFFRGRMVFPTRGRTLDGHPARSDWSERSGSAFGCSRYVRRSAGQRLRKEAER